MKYLLIPLSILFLAGCGSGGGGGGGKTSGGGTSNAASSLQASSVVASSVVASSSTPSSVASSVGVTANQMVPFVLPFDDASGGITNFGEQLNHLPAGKFGAVKTNAQGHFVAGDERIRFLGVNITASSTVTSKANAEKVAKRLAKFGVNLVRFHHMDNHFGGKSIINYAAGTSRTLDAENLDKLDYFIYQLKLNGIYTNLNLLNSREFSAADGLPAEISQLSWKQSHVLGYVNDAFRSLEKEYATLLISHKNPYTNLTYAEDPAVAFVEINNENGIFQQYFDGSIDKWPQVFRTQLNSKWNNWLAAKYTTAAELESAWGAVDEPLGAEKLVNNNFSDGISSWNLEQHDTAKASATTGSFDGRTGAQIKVTQAGSASWNVQLNQSNLVIVKDQLYTLGFWAKADSSRTLGVAVGQAYDPWATLEARNYDIATAWHYIEVQFIARQSDNNVRINFNGFGNQLATVYLANVSFKSGGVIGKLPAGESLAAKNISNNLRAEGYTDGRNKDWVAFLRELETAYWADMNSHIKTGLSYRGLVTGTAIMNTPPGTHKQFDFADAHAYWQHPVFPTADWNAVEWTVENQSMVNTFNNTLTGLAKQRIHGLPFTISEYQHSSPNSFGSEGPLLVAAYGALQDWDGIMMFAYDAAENDNWNAGFFNDFFSMNAHPTKMANMLIAATIFRRGDVAAAQSQLLMNFDPATELDILASKGGAWNIANGSHLNVPNDVPLTKRFALDVSATPQGQTTAPVASTAKTMVADTGELQWNLDVANQGVVTVNTSKTKSVIGFISNRAQQLGNVNIKVATTTRNWATVSLTAVSGNFIDTNAAARILVVATGDAENTNMQWKSAAKNSVGTQWGRSPTLVEVIPVTIELPFASARTKVWVLDETGQRKGELGVTDNAGKAQLILNGATASLWYEIEVSAAN
ncbi:MAG: carbohydrate binding domain-containing protein [Cellvibrio sp.]|uniref:carbohydrate binding domain-containing protein n=1 Tax=Cellvibrio sp. TaxID=1965322 RepID=UPI0031AFC5F3